MTKAYRQIHSGPMVTTPRPPAFLILEDGRRFDGLSFGAPGIAVGEVVFNTSMTGYQEILTDPSYSGQLVTMTYPLIGNYGVNLEDSESDGAKVSGFIVREASRVHSSWRASGSLEHYLQNAGIVGITEVDTRALTRHIRAKGAMRAAIVSGNPTDEGPNNESSVLEHVRAHPLMEGLDLATGVSTREPYSLPAVGEERFHVVAYDFGVKRTSPELLSELGARVTVVPQDFTVEQIDALQPSGVFVSNGPGDPAAVEGIVDVIRTLAGRGIPIFGICLGHQLIARAFGATTYKLPFGHHGGNHPVRNLDLEHVEITAQNHGFAVRVDDDGTVPGAPDLRLTHTNLYDGTAEGLAHRSLPVFCVQYHPEAAPGPHDSRYLFEQFARAMEDSQSTADASTQIA